MSTSQTTGVAVKKLHELRTDLIELAFRLERRGRCDAADVTRAIFDRVSQLCSSFDDSISESDFPKNVSENVRPTVNRSSD